MNSQDTVYMARAPRGYAKPPFWKSFLSKALILVLTIVLVWIIYAYLLAYQLDWLGWVYSKLQPVTNALYAMVETYSPETVRFKLRGAITDELGQRSLFLILLTAVIELVLYSLFSGLNRLYRMVAGNA